MFAKLKVEQKNPKQKTSVLKAHKWPFKTSAQHEAELINLANKQ